MTEIETRLGPVTGVSRRGVDIFLGVPYRELADCWSSTFATFARTGDPNGAGFPHWPRYDTQTRSCLVVDRPPRIESDPDGREARTAYGMG